MPVMQLLLGALLTMGITMLLIPLLERRALQLGLLDRPGGRKQHAAPTPRVGGIAMAVAVLAALLLWRQTLTGLGAFLAALPLLLAFGVLDDRRALAPQWKLGGQMLAALLVMHFGGISIASVRHVGVWMLPDWLSVPLTLGFIVGVTNAFNLADGLDGLAGGTALLCQAGLLLLALTCGNQQVAFLSVVTAGATLGFLRFNTYPARVFMGDAGSQVLGFSAAIFTLRLTQDLEQPYSAALPLLLLGVPVIDTLVVMTERVLEGKSPFVADRLHLHHRLLTLGLGHGEAVMLIYVLQALLLALAWQLRFSSDFLILGCFIGITAATIALLRMARTRAWRLPRHGAPRHGPRIGNGLQRVLMEVGGACIAGYAAIVLWRLGAVGDDLRWLAGGCLLVLGTSLLLRRKAAEAGWFDRAALYVTVLITVAIGNTQALSTVTARALDGIVFGLLGLAVAAALFRDSAARRGITPLDVLVLLVALAIPNLPGSLLAGQSAGWLVVRALLLLYGVECLLSAAAARWRVYDIAGIMFLSLFLLVPLWRGGLS